MGHAGEVVNQAHGVKNLLCTHMEDEGFGDILGAGGFINNAARNSVARHFGSKGEADWARADDDDRECLTHTFGEMPSWGAMLQFISSLN
jgi:hypothetical protein